MSTLLDSMLHYEPYFTPAVIVFAHTCITPFSDTKQTSSSSLPYHSHLYCPTSDAHYHSHLYCLISDARQTSSSSFPISLTPLLLLPVLPFGSMLTLCIISHTSSGPMIDPTTSGSLSQCSHSDSVLTPVQPVYIFLLHYIAQLR